MFMMPNKAWVEMDFTIISSSMRYPEAPFFCSAAIAECPNVWTLDINLTRGVKGYKIEIETSCS